MLIILKISLNYKITMMTINFNNNNKNGQINQINKEIIQDNNILIKKINIIN